MHSLLLGGSSFSQGGPGKGMFSRLHQNVLNRHHWVDLCQSLHQCYGDSGVFGIHAAVFPDYAPKIAEVVAGQLHALTGPMMGGVNDEQLRRAKNMLKSMMVMQTESRVVAVEGECSLGQQIGAEWLTLLDLGRQYMSQGYKESVQEMCTKIDAVTREVGLSPLRRQFS